MMSQKSFFQVTGLIFSVVFLMHAFRLLMGWTIVIAGFSVPVWCSIVGLVVSGYLAYNAFVFAGKGKK